MSKATAVAEALERMRNYPDGSYMRCPFCGCKSATHEPGCAVQIIAAAFVQLERELGTANDIILRHHALLGPVIKSPVAETTISDGARRVLRVPDAGLSKVPGYYYIDPVIEQLKYWGVATDDHLKLTAAHVIEELRKMIEAPAGTLKQASLADLERANELPSEKPGAIDAWKLYCEAFRALYPNTSRVSDTVSPAALQEMVDRLTTTKGT